MSVPGLEDDLQFFRGTPGTLHRREDTFYPVADARHRGLQNVEEDNRDSSLPLLSVKE